MTWTFGVLYSELQLFLITVNAKGVVQYPTTQLVAARFLFHFVCSSLSPIAHHHQAASCVPLTYIRKGIMTVVSHFGTVLNIWHAGGWQSFLTATILLRLLSFLIWLVAIFWYDYYFPQQWLLLHTAMTIVTCAKTDVTFWCSLKYLTHGGLAVIFYCSNWNPTANSRRYDWMNCTMIKNLF